MYLVSAYLDIDLGLPAELEQVVKFCNDNNKPLILCMDSNAHSRLWGSKDNNSRGDMIEDLVFDNNLTIHNKGSRDTFVSHLGSSVIDITITNVHAAGLVENWTVSDWNFASDYEGIAFNLDLKKPGLLKGRSFVKTNWQNFRNILDEQLDLWSIPDLWDQSSIESTSSQLINSLNKALDVEAPFKTRKQRLNLGWYDNELHSAKAKVQARRKAAIKSRLDARWDSYRSSRADYKRLIKKKKKKSWMRFTSEAETIPETGQQAAQLSSETARPLSAGHSHGRAGGHPGCAPLTPLH